MFGEVMEELRNERFLNKSEAHQEYWEEQLGKGSPRERDIWGIRLKKLCLLTDPRTLTPTPTPTPMRMAAHPQRT